MWKKRSLATGQNWGCSRCLYQYAQILPAGAIFVLIIDILFILSLIRYSPFVDSPPPPSPTSILARLAHLITVALLFIGDDKLAEEAEEEKVLVINHINFQVERFKSYIRTNARKGILHSFVQL